MERLKDIFKKYHIPIMGVIICLLILSVVLCFLPVKRDHQNIEVQKREKTETVKYEGKNRIDETPKPDKTPEITPDAKSSAATEKAEHKDREFADKKEDIPNEGEDTETEIFADTAQDKQSESKREYCTISIDCHTVGDNLDKLKPEKRGIIPADGMILSQTEAKINDGDTVFDVLKRVTREKGIHLEFSKTPAYNSIYIEGINNLYEFDCGGLSGWMYSVNGEFPKCSSSQYDVKTGDDIRFLYTCDMGKDVGDVNILD